MDNIEEKISALYDGELNDKEADEVLPVSYTHLTLPTILLV